MKTETCARGGPLILPPFGSFDTPYISLAVLAGYLKSCHIPVSILNTLTFLVKKYCGSAQRLHEEMCTGTPDLQRVPGLMYLPQIGMITKNASIQAPDMETLAFVDYLACNLDQYSHAPEKMWLAIRLSRGCYWKKCSFCRVNLSFCKNYQQPSVARIFTEIQYIVHTTGVRKFLFSDESSNPLILEELSRRIIDSWLAKLFPVIIPLAIFRNFCTTLSSIITTCPSNAGWNSLMKATARFFHTGGCNEHK